MKEISPKDALELATALRLKVLSETGGTTKADIQNAVDSGLVSLPEGVTVDDLKGGLKIGTHQVNPILHDPYNLPSTEATIDRTKLEVLEAVANLELGNTPKEIAKRMANPGAGGQAGLGRVSGKISDPRTPPTGRHTTDDK